MIVSLYDYPSGHTELTMCIGEQLTILSEYVINVSSPPLFSPRQTQLVITNAAYTYTAYFLQQRR